MTIGIIGADAIGQAFGRKVLKAGYQVIISNGRGPESLSSLVRELGAGVRAGFASVDLGDLVAGRRMLQFPGGPLPVHNLIKLP